MKVLRQGTTFLIGFVLSLGLQVSQGFIVAAPSPRISKVASTTLNNKQTHHHKEATHHHHHNHGAHLNLSPQEIIETGVSIDTFAPQFLWLPMIVAPQSELTKKIMGGSNGIAAIVALALVHLTVVITAALQEGALSQILIFTEVFDPSMSQLGGMQKLFEYPNFVAEEWPHVLIWDLFVGRAIWADGLQRNINTRISLAFCNFIGPPGLLIYVATCLLSGKGLPSMMDMEDERNN